MGINLIHLASQGRAYSAARCWTNDELEALLRIEKERGMGRTTAADYVRNGILTLEDFDKATKSKFVPKTMEEAHEEAEKSLMERGRKAVGKTKKVASKEK